MSRQFRSDDTSKWITKYGSGIIGDLTYTTSTYNQGINSCVGTSGSFSLTSSGWSGVTNTPVIIHQTQGPTANTMVNWELNEVVSATTTTLTLRYPLTRDYTAGAQVVGALYARNIAVTGTLTGTSWNGTCGGIGFLMASNKIEVSGSLVLKGATGAAKYGGGFGSVTVGGGFRGGVSDARTSGNSGVNPGRGEGCLDSHGLGGYPGDRSNHLNGGGAGYESGNWDNLAFAGADGGNGSAGMESAQRWGVQVGSSPGIAVGNQELTIAHLGGGAGGAGWYETETNGSGGSGGGMWILMAPIIEFTGTCNLNGGAASNRGGYGAGGSLILKGGQLILGNNLCTATNADASSTYGKGRIAAYYGVSITGSTNPVAYTAQDRSLLKGGTLLIGD